jgi:hypothetical protein
MGLIDMPSTYWAAPSPAQTFLDFRSVALNPAIQRGVIQINATLFQIAIADPVFAIPPHSPEDSLAHKVPPFKFRPHHHSPSEGQSKLYPVLNGPIFLRKFATVNHDL